MTFAAYIVDRNNSRINEMMSVFKSHSDLLLVGKCFNIFYLIVSAVHYTMPKGPER